MRGSLLARKLSEAEPRLGLEGKKRSRDLWPGVNSMLDREEKFEGSGGRRRPEDLVVGFGRGSVAADAVHEGGSSEVPSYPYHFNNSDTLRGAVHDRRFAGGCQLGIVGGVHMKTNHVLVVSRSSALSYHRKGHHFRCFVSLSLGSRSILRNPSWRKRE